MNLDLKDLMDDLEGIGIYYKPELGKDYGYGTEFFSKPTTLTIPNVILSPKVVQYLADTGAISFGKGGSKKWASFNDHEEWMIKKIPYLNGKTCWLSLVMQTGGVSKKDYYILSGTIGEKGFGNSMLKKVSLKTRSFCQKEFLEKLGKYIDEKGLIWST